MLLRFAVTNHLSIRESQELSFAASSLKDRRDGLIDCEANFKQVCIACDRDLWRKCIGQIQYFECNSDHEEIRAVVA